MLADQVRSVADANVAKRLAIAQHLPMNDHERGLLQFLAEPSRRRIRTLLELGEKRRGDVRSLLDHGVQLDPRFCRHLKGQESLVAVVESTLRRAGAPLNCYVLSADVQLDRREMALNDALGAVVGSGNGAFVSCIPGKLAFYEFEDAESSYLLCR